jgi:ribonuclease Z
VTLKVHFLGTGAARSDPHRTTTMLALEDDTDIFLIDCGGDALQRMLQMELAPSKLRALLLTHEHADHVSGFPLLMERLWLHGRREPLPVYGIAPALAQARRLHDSFNIAEWYEHGYPGATWHEVADEQEDAPVLSHDRWHITASPGVHAVPSVGFRVVYEDRCVAYSGDTEPSDAILRLAANADVLIHEATGQGVGHSSALQAAKVAAHAGAKRLYLVHVPSEDMLKADLNAARAHFGETEVAGEGAGLEL